MKFVVSSVDLLHHLQNVSRVISSKNTLPILDNVLFKLDGNTLELTASDLESTFITSMKIENASDSGSIAIPAKLLLDTLKEFPDQPLTFDVNPEDLKIVMSSENGQYDLPGQNGDDFPQLPVIKDENKGSFQLGADVLMNGINNTLFASADDELRPVMSGVLCEVNKNEITFVATDDMEGARSSDFLRWITIRHRIHCIWPTERYSPWFLGSRFYFFITTTHGSIWVGRIFTLCFC